MVPATACGGDDDPAAPDGGLEMGARLLILDPPGDSLGLPFGGEVSLRVRYETNDGEPIAGGEIEFAFVIGPTEATGGAGLADTTATTDDAGIATLDLVAGPERSNFRIRATAARAQSATFYVTVSDAGFTELVAHPTHEGWRPVEDFERVQLRLFRRDIVSCADIDIDDPPESVFAPRTLPGFGGTATFPNLGALEAYTLLAWAELEAGGTRVAYGCVALGASQVVAGPPVLVDALIADRDLALPERAELASHIDLTPVAEAARAAGATLPWDRLACPAGPGQLLLDCALDIAVTTDGDATDCALDEIAALSELVTTLETQRGPVGEDGCRPDVGLDSTLSQAIVTGATWPTGAALDQLLAARTAVSEHVRIHSELTAIGPGVAGHSLREARFDAAADSYAIALAATSRPVIEQPHIAARLVDGTTLEVDEHGFTLRLGAASRDAFTALGLEPHGLGDRVGALGAALADGVDSGSQTGCAALSAIVCDAAGEATSCLQSPCGEAAALLDVRFEDWWKVYADLGLDTTLAGTAPLYDFDDDLRIDSVGANNGGIAEGTWDVRVRLTGDAEAPASGSFGAIGPE